MEMNRSYANRTNREKHCIYIYIYIYIYLSVYPWSVLSLLSFILFLSFNKELLNTINLSIYIYIYIYIIHIYIYIYIYIYIIYIYIYMHISDFYELISYCE